MQHLAGLTRLEYVFCYPESGDIVIAGPAEAWGEAPSGRMQGIESGRPVLELQDLIVALRAFPPGADNKKPFIYCSIDPTEEGLSRMHQFLILAGRGLAAASVAIDPAPHRGAPPSPVSSLRAAFPVLRNPLNRVAPWRLSDDQFRYAFANAVDEDEARRAARRVQRRRPRDAVLPGRLRQPESALELRVDTRIRRVARCW